MIVINSLTDTVSLTDMVKQTDIKITLSTETISQKVVVSLKRAEINCFITVILDPRITKGDAYFVIIRITRPRTA